MLGLSKSFRALANSSTQAKGWFFILFAYFTLHYVLRVGLSDTLQIDAAEQVVQSQDLLFDYGNFQPPLFTWLLHTLWLFVEPSMESFVAFRYILLLAAFWLWHLVSRLLFNSPILQLISSSSWLLMYEFAWKLHQGSTHTTLMLLALMLTLHAVLLLLTKKSLGLYIYLGFVVALGVSSKYSFTGFALLALMAGLLVPKFRKIILHPYLSISVIVASLLSVPALIPLFLGRETVESGLQNQMGYSDFGVLMGNSDSASRVITAAIEFMLPLIFFMIFTSKNKWKSLKDDNVGWWLFLIIVGYLLGFLVTSFFIDMSQLKSRWLHPFLFVMPFLLIKLMDFEGKKYRVASYFISVALFSVIVFSGRYVQLTTVDLERPNRLVIPISSAIKNLKMPDELGDGYVYTEDVFLAAHLRVIKKVKVIVKSEGKHGGYFFKGNIIDRSSANKKDEKLNSSIGFNDDLAYKISWVKL